jgi:hypothetical protein
MGSIRDTSKGRTKQLEPELLVGRAPTCALRLDLRYVSAQHAVLRFTAGRWGVKDLGSRNGTFVDGRRIRPGHDVSIEKGARLAFGKLEEQWELADDSPPCVMAVPLDGGDPVLFEGDLLALPSGDDPQMTIYPAGGGAWMAEMADGAALPLQNGQTFDVGDRTFRFSCDVSVPATSMLEGGAAIEVRNVALSFRVTRDEEHVELRAVCAGKTFDIGARSHNYLLLTLARKRLADAAQGVAEAARGWVDQDTLAHDPSMAPPQLNIDVFRIRRQFAGLGLRDAANIVERRPRTRQLRIGTGQITVVII